MTWMPEQHARLKWGVVLLAAMLALVGCSSEEGDDLDKFIKESGKEFRGKVDPLPEVTPFVPVEFNADGTLNDPFKPRQAQSDKEKKGGGLQPDLNRPREAMEAYPLESLKYVGSLYKAKLKFALVKAPDNAVNQLTIGNYLGQNLGMVVDITDNEIKIKEIVQDELSGDWVERAASLSLQE
ncbi:hypothetical protein BAC2_00726 [uncultured bacterium]|nr:hypothetical protein BAC2_00726 [uncultured bacterium]